jgi:hypothetical protein
VAVAALALCGAPARAMEIVVPAYFYPSAGSPWTALTAAADDVEITAIMNPGNGPGANVDINYKNAVNALRAAGGRVIGYVYTSYGSRPLAQVTADVDKYAAMYSVDGIFVDEMANSGPAERLNYYKSIYEHVKAINPDWEVMGNPGTTTIEQYLTWPAADRLMVFENVGANYPAYVPSAWNSNYDRSRFVHLVHTQPTSAAMEANIASSVARNAGGVYVTNDVLGNPWDTLPTYWQAEVDAVAAANEAFASSDFTEDGQVDGGDLGAWERGYGRAAPSVWRRDGDADGNNVVDGEDFLRWQRDLPSPPGGGSALSGVAVAEPGSSGLALAATIVLQLSRVGRRAFHGSPSTLMSNRSTRSC